ncbi:MAG: transposase [Methylotenera sp.]|nr:transposase [Methylotenera sp.]
MCPLPHQSNLRRGRYSQANQIYHVISNTGNRQPIFENLKYARIIIQNLMIQDQKECTKTLAFIVMPDHIHWLLELKEIKTLANIVKIVKAKTAQTIGKPIWQAGYYDHAIRKEEDIQNIARYIVANPVRAGLVTKVGDYPHWDAIWL